MDSRCPGGFTCAIRRGLNSSPTGTHSAAIIALTALSRVLLFDHFILPTREGPTIGMLARAVDTPVTGNLLRPPLLKPVPKGGDWRRLPCEADNRKDKGRWSRAKSCPKSSRFQRQSRRWSHGELPGDRNEGFFCGVGRRVSFGFHLGWLPCLGLRLEAGAVEN